MKINNLNFGTNYSVEANGKKETKTNKTEKNINYNKINHPNEFLGRSIVNFTGAVSKQELSAKLSALAALDEITLKNIEDSTSEDISAKLDFYNFAKNLPDVEKNMLEGYLNCVNHQNIELAKLFLSDNEKLYYDTEKILTPKGTDEEVKSAISARVKLYEECKNSDVIPKSRFKQFLGYACEENLNLIYATLFDKNIWQEMEINPNTTFVIFNETGTLEEQRAAFDTKLDFYKRCNYPYGASSTLSAIKDYNEEFALALLSDKDLDTHDYGVYLIINNSDKLPREDFTDVIKSREEIYNFIKSNVPKDKQKDMSDIIRQVMPENIDLAKKLIKDGIVQKKYIPDILYASLKAPKKDKQEYFDAKLKLYEYAKSTYYNEHNLPLILTAADKDNSEVLKKFISSRDFPDREDYKTVNILKTITPDNADFAKKAIHSGFLEADEVYSILKAEGTQEEQQEIFKKREKIYNHIFSLPKSKIEALGSSYAIGSIIKNTKPFNYNFILNLINDDNISDEKIWNITSSNCTKDEDINEHFGLKDKMYNMIKDDPSFTPEERGDVLVAINNINFEAVKTLAFENLVPRDSIRDLTFGYDKFDSREQIIQTKMEFYEKVKNKHRLLKKDLAEVMHYVDSLNLNLAVMLVLDGNISKDTIIKLLKPDEYEEKESYKEKTDIRTQFSETVKRAHPYDLEQFIDIIYYVNKNNCGFTSALINDKLLSAKNIALILASEHSKDDKKSKANMEAKLEIYNRIKKNRHFEKSEITNILRYTTEDNLESAHKAISEAENKRISHNGIIAVIQGDIKFEELMALTNSIGRHNVDKFEPKDLKAAYKFLPAFRKNNINEISSDGKRVFLKSLIDTNTDTFTISDKLKKEFPLLPSNSEQYCSLLPSIVTSLGIETAPISEEENIKFNKNLTGLSSSLADLSDDEFNNLEITQEYSTEEFVKDTMDAVKDLSREERNKVYDYFGYELHHKGKTYKDGFYLTGYPANLNNGKKLAQITDFKTRNVIEKLRPAVIRYSCENKINCPQNKQIESLLNDVFDTLYEMHPMIQKPQHGVHSFDLMKHTLKVMQKISQDENFKKLDNSDKKIMLMASLLHDIAKKEAKADYSHAENGSFDAYFISKKINLTKDEQYKLYNLIKHHEWLQNVNKEDAELRKKMMRSTAYDLRHDNLFEMALIFAHADLKAVKNNDSFHDVKEGKGRVEIDGKIRSFGEAANIYAGKKDDTVKSNTIRGYINELKKSQPLLPVTKIPSASTIAKNITQTYLDGSTNIKGVYKDKDGLIIVKYNEVENWEDLGFPKGTVSHGIKADGKHKNKFWHVEDEPVNTGNIKFFAHGVSSEEKNLAKFDAFSLMDSDVLLSVSYAERPESKYRFFRPRGLLLNVDTKNIHGGGETDSGSGCGKTTADFKKRYIFGAEREKDRVFVANLVKSALDLNDDEYIKFVEKNRNKSILEIEPPEARESLVKAYASINSKTRNGGREYNEMYISNPEAMAAFMYGAKSDIGNPVEYIDKECKKEKEQEHYSYYGAIPVTPLKEYAIKRDMPMIIFGN